MNYHELTRKLRSLGCVFDRQAKGSHEIWLNVRTGMRTTIPNWGSKDLKAGTISRIVRDLGVTKDHFEKA
ncbi:MAG: type II toxin-antitoxin system HicA family toxin [Chloroflexi bacterium]|nr:type II toxin-antitoxin system HicA family toxin [Chloroflexota bacterium]